MIMVFLLYIFIESPFVKIPQDYNIVDFLGYDEWEEVNSEEYIKRWWCCYVLLYSYVSSLCLYDAYGIPMFCL